MNSLRLSGVLNYGTGEMAFPDARLRHEAGMGAGPPPTRAEEDVVMRNQVPQQRSGAEHARRDPGRAGAPAEAEGGTAGIEAQLVELKTRVGGLETHSERTENRWEKWRSEDQRRHTELRQEQMVLREEQTELRKEQTELRKEQTELRKEMVAGFRRLDERHEARGREMAESFRRVSEKLEEVRQAADQLTQKFILRVEMAALLILAAILGTGIFG